MVASRRLLLLPWVVPAAAAFDDTEVLLQQAVHEASGTTGMAVLSKMFQGLNISYDLLRQPQPVLEHPSVTKHVLHNLAAEADEHKAKLTSFWDKFVNRASKSTKANPEELLGHAKAALVETGAMSALKKMAMEGKRSSDLLTGKRSRGAVPLDSMVIGFTSSLAPWNNLLMKMGIPLIKAKFELFANMFGPTGKDARICIASYVQCDSKFGANENSEYGATTLFVGPAKWDNVPGWSFGSGGGFEKIKVVDVADFGWKWTFAYEPETVGFFFDIQLLDSKQRQQPLALLEMGNNVTQTKITPPPTHGSTWFGHTWCSPDWTNYPMILEEPPDHLEQPKLAAAVTVPPDEYDPDAEAV